MSPSSNVGRRWCSSQASKVSAFGAIIGLGRDDAPQTQAADKGDRFVMAVRDAAAQTPTTPTAAVAARHVRRRPGLVDEHQFQRIKVELAGKPFPSPLQDVRAILLACVRRLF